jgi:uroporphyrinogen-III synthase
MSHVLITRPLPAARELAEELERHGLQPVVMPVYDFVGRDPGDLSGLQAPPPTRKLAVFTSPRAVQFGAKYLPGAATAGVQLAVVGSTTRHALEELGFSVDLQAESGYTSEDLLQLKALDTNPGEATIFCAPGGREKLADGLAERGWHVIKAFVYERVELAPEDEPLQVIARAKSLISVWTSNAAVDIAQKHMPATSWKKILQAPLLVISARMQRYLEDLGASRVMLADSPANPDLLRSILQIHDHEGGN